MRTPRALALAGLLGACAGPLEPPAGAERAATDLSAFERTHPFRSPAWGSVLVSHSLVKGGPLRIHFDKAAVTEALLADAAGEGREPAPLPYRDGTAFVAQRLALDGRVQGTQVLIAREKGPPELRLFDAEGAPADAFRRPGDPPDGPTGRAPAACLACHAGTDVFEPMSAFPNEPASFQLELDSRYRSLRIVQRLRGERLREASARSHGAFGPYGSIWLSMLAADARGGRLSLDDRAHFERLLPRYRELLEGTR